MSGSEKEYSNDEKSPFTLTLGMDPFPPDAFHICLCTTPLYDFHLPSRFILRISVLSERVYAQSRF